MKIFCEVHGQPLALSPERGEWSCKMTGCLTAIPVEITSGLEARIGTFARPVELWLAPK